MPVLSDYRNIIKDLLNKNTDINCDLGEGLGNDELIIPYIISANISCGYHAGDASSIVKTMEACKKHNVDIGAHPSFFDKKNFGRSEMNLSAEELYELIFQQLFIFKELADMNGQKIKHVKPHGALYNMSAKNSFIAATIAKAVLDFDAGLILYGLSGSSSVSEAEKLGLKTANEVFADRSYQDDGSLTPRNQPNALIEEPKKALQQVLQMINESTTTTVAGNKISLKAETICIHGDGKNAVEIVKAIYEAIKN